MNRLRMLKKSMLAYMDSIWTYAQGAPPLILPESIGKPLKRLYAEGNTVNANKELPETYRQLEYIESTGTQFFSFAGITLSVKAKLEYEAQHISSSGNQRIFSYGSVAGKNNFSMWEYNTGYRCSVLGAENELPNETVSEKHKIVMERIDETHCNLYINDTLAGTYTGEFTQTGSIFTVCGGNNQNYVGKLYYLKLWSDDVLIYDFIPCYRKSDNVVGLYDLVSKVFYTNVGTGDFIKGNEVTEVGYVGDLNEETGKYDVPITVRGKNILNTYGFGARNFNSPTAARYLTNDYGTTVSTTAPANLLTVTQTKTGNPSTPWVYNNGYFSMGLNDEIEDGKSYRLSCDIEIVNNPLNVKNIQVLINGGGDNIQVLSIENGRGSCSFKYKSLKDLPDRKLLEFRNAGCSMNISNIMITKISDTDITYEPYRAKTDLTVFLDTPIGAGEGAYINAEIPTVKGTTIIEVNTSVPPAALKTYYRKAR